MKGFVRFLALTALLWAGSLYYEVRSMWATVVIWPVRLIAIATAPFVAMVGAIVALSSLLRGDLPALLMGGAGVGLAANYIRRVTAPHDEFANTFGPDWYQRLTPQAQCYMLPRRWQRELPYVPPARWRRDVPFWTVGEDHDLLCDIWQPPEDIAPSGLALIYLHGSGWRYGDKDLGTRPMFRRLAAQGHVIMDVAYRLAPEVQYCDMVGDVKRAVVWLKDHAAEYGVDPARIVVGGGSAGGHLALLAAYTPGLPALQPADVDGDTSVCGVISWYGPPDLQSAYDYSVATFGSCGSGKTTYEQQFIARVKRFAPALSYTLDWMIGEVMGGSPEEIPDDYALASPIKHVGSHCPPTLLLQGEYDVGIRPDSVCRLHRALLDEGVPAMYVEYPYTDHAFDVLLPQLYPPAAQAALFDAERFLALLAQDTSTSA